MSTMTVRATTVAAVAMFALGGVVFTASAASAEPKNTGGPKGCAVFHADTGTSEEVPDGTLIIAASGSIKQCKDGSWVTVPERVGVSGNVRALAVTPSLATLR